MKGNVFIINSSYGVIVDSSTNTQKKIERIKKRLGDRFLGCKIGEDCTTHVADMNALARHFEVTPKIAQKGNFDDFCDALTYIKDIKRNKPKQKDYMPIIELFNDKKCISTVELSKLFNACFYTLSNKYSILVNSMKDNNFIKNNVFILPHGRVSKVLFTIEGLSVFHLSGYNGFERKKIELIEYMKKKRNVS